MNDVNTHTTTEEDHRYGLPEETITRLTNCIRKNERVEKIILHGSRAKGTYKKYSDIDLSLKGNELTIHDLFDILNRVDDLYLPYEMDMSIYHTLDNPAFIAEIDRYGVEI